MHARDWDRLAAIYEKEVCDIFVRDRRRVIARWLRARGLLRGGKTLLDAGCGIGSFIRKYGRHFGAKTGTDHSRRMLRIAAARCRHVPGCTWLQADVQRLPASLQGSADLVVCSNVLTFVSTVACSRALRQVALCAKPGAWLLLVLPSLESHDAVVALETGRSPAKRLGVTAIVRRDDRRQRFYTHRGAVEFVARAGLRSVAVRKVWYPWIDEGVTREPRNRELPWDWLVTARR
jgi:ubiquinone/menaquinone biosynthesis C-methylase UbiE